MKKFPLYVLPSLSLKLFTGRINSSVFYESFACSDLTVKQKNVFAHVDGESIESGSEVKVSIVPGSLNILIPEV